MIAEGFEDLTSNLVNKYPTSGLSHMSTKPSYWMKRWRETESTYSIRIVEITQWRN